MSLGGGSGFGGGGKGDKALQMPLMETLRLAWADPELRQKLLFVLMIFAVYTVGIHVPVPIPGVSSQDVFEALKGNPIFGFIDAFGGGALKRVSVFALGLNPYITSSIILQILTTAYPQWKKELQEGGEYARRQQNKRTRMLTLILCYFQGFGLLSLVAQAGIPITLLDRLLVCTFWTAGAMFILWLGEQISEKGIGNGVSLMIFAGITISLPGQTQTLWEWATDFGRWFSAIVLIAIFLGTTWFIVFFTAAQRRIPIQHMRRQVGARSMPGQTSYLPLSVNMAGVIPIIFAVSLIFIPAQFASMFSKYPTIHDILRTMADYLNPGSPFPQGLIGSLAYAALIFFFTYFYTAIQYNVEDISNNLKRGGSFIPGVRPGKQTKDFLDGVISRITIVGAAFLTVVALTQYLAPAIVLIPQGVVSIIGGTSLLIMVSVALETMRQIEANLLMKRYGS